MKTFSHWLTSPKARVWLIIVLAILVRLYRVHNPVGDWHAFRQADTASVTREFVKHGIDILRPRYHDLSNIQSGQDNLEGYRMVELPLVNALVAWLVKTLSLPLVLTSRLLSITASVVTLWFLVGFVHKITGNKNAGMLSGFFFALMPYSIYYSRVILPEPFVLLCSMGSLYWLVCALEADNPFRQKTWWFSALALSIALLLKPFAAFLAPLYAVLIWHKKSARFSPWWAVYAAIALVPLWWWREWIAQFPSGIPASDWLWNGNGIRLRPAWFRWLFWERFTKLILGYAGIVVAGASLWWKQQGRTELLAWWTGLILYAVIVATGNVQHDYYQIIFTPLLCFTLALGTLQAWQWAKNTRWKQGLVVSLLLLGWCASWQQIAGYFNVNHWEYVEAGEAVDRLTPADAAVIAPAFGDTQFLFQTNRTGWPIGFEIDDKIAKGAQYYVTTSDDDEARELSRRFTIIEKSERFTLIDLTKPHEGIQP